MKWTDHGSSIELYTPLAFNFAQCLVFLDRSNQETLHRINAGYLVKLLKFDEEVVFCQIASKQNSMHVNFPLTSPSAATRKKSCRLFMAMV